MKNFSKIGGTSKGVKVQRKKKIQKSKKIKEIKQIKEIDPSTP